VTTLSAGTDKTAGSGEHIEYLSKYLSHAGSTASCQAPFTWLTTNRCVPARPLA